MGQLRALGRVIALGAVTGFFYALLAAGRLLTLGAPRLRGRVRGHCFRGWSRAVLAVMGARVGVRGAPPRQPFLLVSNHLGYVDILVLASRVDAVFVAKSEIASWPLAGHLCRAVGTLFVDRQDRRDLPRVLDAIDRALAAGRGVILFPEGTSTDGSAVAPFHPSLLAGAARAGTPVHWASLSYATPPGAAPAREAICWWGDMELPGHLFELLSQPGFEATVVFGGAPLQATDRKALAGELRRAVSGAFTPVGTPAPTAG